MIVDNLLSIDGVNDGSSLLHADLAFIVGYGLIVKIPGLFLLNLVEEHFPELLPCLGVVELKLSEDVAESLPDPLVLRTEILGVLSKVGLGVPLLHPSELVFLCDLGLFGVAVEENQVLLP